MSDRTELVAVIDANGAVAGWTEAAERLWRSPAGAVLARPALALLDGADLPRARAAEPWSGTVGLRRGDGGGGRVHLRAAPLTVSDPAGHWQTWEAAPAEPDDGPADRAPGPEILRRVLECSPVGVMLWDRQLRCLWRNDAASALGLVPAGSQGGHAAEELLVAGGSDWLTAALRRTLDGAAPSSGLERVVPAAAGKSERTLSLSLFRLDSADGRTLGVCLLAVDVSEYAARQGRRRLLVEAGTRIGTTLDVMTTAQELAETAVPTVADYVTVDLADTVGPDDEPLERINSTEASIPAFYRAAAASVRPGTPESLWERGEPVFVPPLSPFTSVLISGESHFEPFLDTSPGGWLDKDPDRARLIHENGMHSLMVVPLRAGGSVLGVAVFVRTKNPAPFTRSDLILAEGLVARASVSLEHASRYSREHTAALALQRDLLPHRLRGGAAVEVASRYLPADTRGGVGGDWYDVFPQPDGQVALVVGDVVGHGIHAAATMGRIRTAVNTLSNLRLPPAELLARLDELVGQLAADRPEEELNLPNISATCVYALYDPATRRCTMARAGHPPPAIVSPDGAVEFVELPTGTPIGLGLGVFESVEVEVPEGSVIALYTDGLVESREYPIDRGLERLRGALGQRAAGLAELSDGVIRTMTAEGESEDDIALLVARTRPVPDPADE